MIRPRAAVSAPSRRRLAAAAAVFAATAGVQAGDTVRSYGTGSPGTGGFEPRAWVSTTPRVGASFGLTVDRSLGGTWGIPLLGVAPANIPYLNLNLAVDPRGMVLLLPFRVRGNGAGSGTGTLTLPVPANPNVLNTPLYLQVLTLDDGAPGTGFAATRGLEVTPTLHPAVLATTAVPGAADPLLVIDPVSGSSAPIGGPTIADGGGIVFAASGEVAFGLDRATGVVHAFDTSGAGIYWTASAATTPGGEATRLAITPDGSRLYVLKNGVGGTTPTIDVLSAALDSALGQPYPGGPLRIEGLADAQRLVFAADSRRGYLGALGPFSAAGGAVLAIDTDPGSATYHQVLDRIVFSGKILTDLERSPDGKLLYASLLGFNIGELAIIDVASFTVIDVDQVAPGVQNLGGEVQMLRTPIPLAISRIRVDPRGGWVYLATVGGVARVGVDAGSLDYRRVLVATAGVPATELVRDLALTDAGELLYLATAAEVVELDTDSLVAAQRWPVRDAHELTQR